MTRAAALRRRFQGRVSRASRAMLNGSEPSRPGTFAIGGFFGACFSARSAFNSGFGIRTVLTRLLPDDSLTVYRSPQGGERALGPAVKRLQQHLAKFACATILNGVLSGVEAHERRSEDCEAGPHRRPGR